MREMITEKDQERYVRKEIYRMRQNFSYIRNYIMTDHPDFRKILKDIICNCKVLLAAFKAQSFIIHNQLKYECLICIIFSRAEWMLKNKKRR